MPASPLEAELEGLRALLFFVPIPEIASIKDAGGVGDSWNDPCCRPFARDGKFAQHDTFVTERVPVRTAGTINRRLRREAEDRLTYYAEHPEQIEARLEVLAREWDIERTLQANAASLALAGIVLGVAANRRWLTLPAAVTAFLLQHGASVFEPHMRSLVNATP